MQPTRSNSGTSYDRILSLDGGGVHALAYLPILEHMERRLGSLVRSGHFRLFAGTSTGAIVAAALKIGISASELVSLYESLATRVFRKVPPWSRIAFKYHSDP